MVKHLKPQNPKQLKCCLLNTKCDKLDQINRYLCLLVICFLCYIILDFLQFNYNIYHNGREWLRRLKTSIKEPWWLGGAEGQSWVDRAADAVAAASRHRLANRENMLKNWCQTFEISACNLKTSKFNRRIKWENWSISDKIVIKWTNSACRFGASQARPNTYEIHDEHHGPRLRCHEEGVHGAEDGQDGVDRQEVCRIGRYNGKIQNTTRTHSNNGRYRPDER